VLGAKKKGLGAKKVTSDLAVDFEEAERKAKEEAERIAKLGYNPDEETPAAPAAKATTSDDKIVAPTPLSPSRAGGFGATNKPRERSNSELERLGMGMGRLGFGQTAGAKPAPKKMGFGAVGRSVQEEGMFHISRITLQRQVLTRLTDESNQFARQKFGMQKGISSDEFFGRGAFDANSQSEAKSRLQNFDGATSISSNAYFGRPEDELQGAEDYGDLETAAKDFVRKFGITAGDDLENLTQVLGEGAVKLQGAIRSYLNG
jgi:ADP-ribosylation factor GTPase-activating protein 2/3